MPEHVRGALKAAIAVFLVSLALRAGWAAGARVTPIGDFHGYDKLARKWLDTGQLGWRGALAYRTPGYPGFLATAYLVFGHSWKAVGLAQAVLGALSSGVLVLLAAHIVSIRASVIAGLLHAVSPTALAYVPVLASENLALPLVASASLSLAIADRQSGWRKYLAAAAFGVFYGFLLLVRPAALFLLPAWLLLAAYSPPQRVWRLRCALVFVVMAVLPLLPWLARNYRVGLGPTTLATVGGINLHMGNNDLASTGGYCGPAVRIATRDEKQRDADYRSAALTWIRTHPWRYLALCRTRAARLFGTEPDGWAARYLTPTADNDTAVTTVYRADKSGEQVSSLLVQRRNAVERRNRAVLGWIRVVIAPLTLLALALSIARWRCYAIVVWPALCYLAGVTATFAQARFREPVDPLLFVPLAALLADLCFGSREIGRWSSPKSKAIAAASVVAATAALHAAGWAERWYRIPALPAPAPVIAGYSFEKVLFLGPASRYKSSWTQRTKSVTVTLEQAGVRCDIVGSSDSSAGQYGGVQFPVLAVEALRLDVSFTKPEGIRAVFVDGYDLSGKRQLRWVWRLFDETRPPNRRATYVLIPAERSGYFIPRHAAEIDSVRSIHLFLLVAPNSEAGFVLHQAEIGRATTG